MLARVDNEERTCLVNAVASEPGSVMMNDGTFWRHALLPWTRGNLQRQQCSLSKLPTPAVSHSVSYELGKQHALLQLVISTYWHHWQNQCIHLAQFRSAHA